MICPACKDMKLSPIVKTALRACNDCRHGVLSEVMVVVTGPDPLGVVLATRPTNTLCRMFVLEKLLVINTDALVHVQPKPIQLVLRLT